MGADSTFIPYGAPVGKVPTTAVLGRLGLEAGRYFLYVSRFEPENNALLVREAFRGIGHGHETGTRRRRALRSRLHRAREDTTDPRIVIPGAIYGDGYHELQSHSFAYIHATEVGGTHPALIEAMGRGALVLYLRTPENEEVAGGVGVPFAAGELTEAMRRISRTHRCRRPACGGAAPCGGALQLGCRDLFVRATVPPAVRRS